MPAPNPIRASGISRFSSQLDLSFRMADSLGLYSEYGGNSFSAFSINGIDEYIESDSMMKMR